jgi:hypothetical protein
MSDDAYQRFQCKGNLWGTYHVNVLYVDSGNLLLGISRCLAFMMFIGFQSRNRYLLTKKQENNVNIIKDLILPSYLPFIYFYMAFSCLTGLIDLLNQATNRRPQQVDFWIYPVEVGITHWFLEGLALFLIRFGAGFDAIRRSFRLSFLWGTFTTFWFFFVFAILDNRLNQDKDEEKDKLYAMFISYEVVLFLFYSAYAIIPSKFLYHRPALTFYARFTAISQLVVIIFASLYYEEKYEVVCPGSIIAFIFSAFLQPMAIYKTLQIDSQYWQGLSPEAGNPLTEVWDHLGIDTASSLAANLEELGRQNLKLPIIHFGLTKFDKDLVFVAGGFSRVYFGTLRKQRVAFKILFAMELDPKDVEEFYREAAVLHALKHPNVVQCLGVCVMPPALTIVLELCKHGSLFDFLYKPVNVAVPQKQTKTVASSMRDSLVGTRNSLIGFFNPSEIELPSMSAGAGGAGAATGGGNNNNNNNNNFSRNSSNRNSDVIAPGGRARLSLMGAQEPEGEASATVNPLNLKGSSSSAATSNRNSANFIPGSTTVSSGVHTPQYFSGTDAGDNRSTMSRTLSNIMQTPFRKEDLSNRNSNSQTKPASMQPGATSAAAMSVPAKPTTLGNTLSFNGRLLMMRDAVSGIAHLHSKGYIHCDIKSLNFLVSEVFICPIYSHLRSIILCLLFL